MIAFLLPAKTTFIFSFLISHSSFLISHSSFLIPHFSFLISHSSLNSPSPCNPQTFKLFTSRFIGRVKCFYFFPKRRRMVHLRKVANLMHNDIVD